MLVYLLIVVGLFSRLIPHTVNLVPIAAIALFGGVYLNKKLVPWVPLVIMIISDLFIGMHSVIFYTWGAFVLTGFVGLWLRNHKSPVNIFAAAVFSSIMFYLLTNLGVWIAWYPHTVASFVDCYVKAIPFFRNTLAGNIIFSAVFFGAYEMAKQTIKNRSIARVFLAG